MTSKMYEMNQFPVNHSLHLESNWKPLMNDCLGIQTFLKDYDMAFDLEGLKFVKTLHDGTHPEIDAWRECEIGSRWLNFIQSIKIFPSYDILLAMVEIYQAAFRAFAAQFDRPPWSLYD